MTNYSNPDPLPQNPVYLSQKSNDTSINTSTPAGQKITTDANQSGDTMNREDESLFIKKVEIDINMDELKIIRDRMLKMC